MAFKKRILKVHCEDESNRYPDSVLILLLKKRGVTEYGLRMFAS